jgi:hypothetical protein
MDVGPAGGKIKGCVLGGVCCGTHPPREIVSSCSHAIHSIAPRNSFPAMFDSAIAEDSMIDVFLYGHTWVISNDSPEGHAGVSPLHEEAVPSVQGFHMIVYETYRLRSSVQGGVTITGSEDSSVRTLIRWRWPGIAAASRNR